MRKPDGHLFKFLATGAAGLTAGTVQGVIQVKPANADWLYRAGHAGEWIDPISHAHINLVTGLTMLVAGGLLYLVPRLGGTPPSRRAVNACFYTLLSGSLAFYGVALYLGFHEGGLVVGARLTPEQAEAATPLHPYLLMTAGVAMLAGFWLLLYLIVRAFLRSRSFVRPFVLAGCAALAVGTLQGPVQAFPAVNELLDRSGDAGDVIVNLHAQLNMLGGLMVVLVGLALMLLRIQAPEKWPRGVARIVPVAVPAGMAVYYAGGIAFAAVEAHQVADGRSFGAAVGGLEPWPALVLAPAALAVLVGFGAFASAAWRMTVGYREAGRRLVKAAPAAYTGTSRDGYAGASRGHRRLRAADGSARLSRGGLAVRRFPVHGNDPADRRSSPRLGGYPARLLAITVRGRFATSGGRSSSSGCPPARSCRPRCSTGRSGAG